MAGKVILEKEEYDELVRKVALVTEAEGMMAKATEVRDRVEQDLKSYKKKETLLEKRIEDYQERLRRNEIKEIDLRNLHKEVDDLINSYFQ